MAAVLPQTILWKFKRLYPAASAVKPPPRQAAGRCRQCGTVWCEQRNRKLKIETNMNFRAIIFMFFCTFTIMLNAQSEYLIESENDLFWQPNVEIKFSHYQAKTDSACLKYYEKYGLQMSSNIGIRGVVDIPKTHLSKSIRKRKGFDKSYLAPVFCKNCSCKLSEDSLTLKVDQLLFDVAEICVRGTRKELFERQSEMNINNVNTMFFTTVKNSWDEKMQSFFGSILREILIEKKEEAYAEWRQTVDELLQQTENFATQPQDCYRFVLGEPIEKNYVKAEWITGDLRNRNEK
jgi:hypothetical protein